MQSQNKILTISVMICQMFSNVISPAVPGHKCGLARHRRFEDSRRQIIKYTKAGGYELAWAEVPSVKDPPDYASLTPTTSTPRVIFDLTKERCDYIRLQCMKTYVTGAVCARTVDYLYYTFSSYCVLDFYNCLARLDNVWSIAYMGYCVPIDMDRELYVDMTYDQMSNNSKLLQMYIADVGDETDFHGYATTPPPTEFTKKTSTVKTTVLFNVLNVTDKNGTYVTDNKGNQVTVTELITVPYENVTDKDGSVMTDYDGDYLTFTLTTEGTTNTTTKATNE